MGPVFDIMVFNRRITVIMGIDDAREILMKRPKVFRRLETAKEPFQNIYMHRGLLVSEGSDWSKQRKVVAPPFNRQNVTLMLDDIWMESVKFANNLRKYADGNMTVDFVRQSTVMATSVIGRVAFGFNERDGAYFYSSEFVQDLQDMLFYVSQRMLFPFPSFMWKITSKYQYEVKAKAAAEKVKRFGMSVIENAKNKPAHDQDSSRVSFLQSVLRAEESSKLSDDETISNIVTVFLAGTDTTAIAICWTLYYLSLNPIILEEVLDEVNQMDKYFSSSERMSHLKLCSACFNEAMRLKGPVFALGFELVDRTEPYVFSSGTIIRPNDNISIPLEAFKLNEYIFDNPNNFDPYRWINNSEKKLNLMHKYCMTFGGGPRICPGLDLAQVEGVFCIANVVKNYSFELACPPDELHRTLAVAVHINKMPLNLVART
jgi:cytochrome P450